VIPKIQKPGGVAVASAADLVESLTQPGMQLYHQYVNQYESKQEQALQKHKKLLAKTRKNARRQNVIQQAVASASASGFGDKRNAKQEDEEEEDSEDYSSDEEISRPSKGLVEFVQQLGNPGSEQPTELPVMPFWQQALKEQAGVSSPLSQSFSAAGKPLASASSVPHTSPAQAVPSPDTRARIEVSALRQSVDRKPPGSPTLTTRISGSAQVVRPSGSSLAERGSGGTGLPGSTRPAAASNNMQHVINHHHTAVQHAVTGMHSNRPSEHTNEGMRRLQAILGPGTSLSSPQLILDSHSSLDSGEPSPTSGAPQHGRRAGTRPTSLTNSTSLTSTQTVPPPPVPGPLSSSHAAVGASTGGYTPSMLTAEPLPMRRSLAGRSIQQVLAGRDSHGGSDGEHSGRAGAGAHGSAGTKLGGGGAAGSAGKEAGAGGKTWWRAPGHKPGPVAGRRMA